MGYFTLKIAVVALLALAALTIPPVAAIAAMRRSRAANGSRACSAGHTGRVVAGLLLHREGLAREITVETCHDESGEGYAPHSLCIRIHETRAGSRSLAALAESAFAVAAATRHADADAGFLRTAARATRVAILANLLPVAAALGIALPEARGLLFIVCPVILGALLVYTALGLPDETHTADAALILLRRHDMIADAEVIPVIAHLRTRAALALARPVRTCIWVAWAL